MFRLFDNLVDPYAKYEETDAPPQEILLFLRDYAQPLKGVFLVMGVLSVVVAIIVVWLLGYLVVWCIF